MYGSSQSIWASSGNLYGSLDYRRELDTWGDIIDMRLKVLWYVIPVALLADTCFFGAEYILVCTNANFGAVFVFMLMEFSEKQILGFLNCNIYGNPALVLVVHDSRVMNAEVRQPCFDVGYSLVLWSEHIMNLLCTPMLAILVGIGVGTIFKHVSI